MRLAFDEELEASGDVASSLAIEIDGEEPDASVVAREAFVEGSELVVRLSPTEAADGSSAAVYFALYAGLLSVGAADESGALGTVRAADDGACAVLDDPALFVVPSGLAFDIVSAVEGDEEAGVCAETVIEVSSFAQLRVISWVTLGEDGPVVFKHNHQFLRDTNATAADSLAQAISTGTDGAFTAVAEGRQVTITATEPHDGQLIEPTLVEGAVDDFDAAMTETVDAALASAAAMAG